MPIPVTGYLSRDGNFFTSECEARMHEAEMEIRTHCAVNHIDGEKVLSIIEALADSILEYVNASQEFRDEKAREIEAGREGQEDRDGEEFVAAELGKYPTDDLSTDENSQAIFEQSPDGHEPVPDVGSGPSSETVYDDRPRSRSRSRRRNA